MIDKLTAMQVRQVMEPPPMCDLETVLACERALHDTILNIVKHHHEIGYEPTASEDYIVSALRKELSMAQAGYRELCKRRDEDH